ncbi:MAG: hypothetical protein AAF750_12705 [Planctomycetota bacterium]
MNPQRTASRARHALAALLLAALLTALTPTPHANAQATLQPPDWVKPGMRLVYWTGTYTRQSSGTVFVPDPEGPIKDDQGNRWRIVHRGADRGGAELGPVAGMGYAVVDVVAVEGDRVVLDTRTLTVLNRRVHFTGRTATHHDLATGNGTWLDRDRLQRLQAGQLLPGEATGPYQLADGRPLPSVLFIRHTNTGHTIFDLATGAQASDLTRARVTPGKNAGPSGKLTDAKRETVGLAYLKSLRPIDLPWTNGSPPDWVARTPTLHYRGTRTVHTPGTPTIPQPTERLATLQHAANTYTLHTESSYDTLAGVRQLATTTPIATGPASVGGYWIDPNALNRLESNTRLDRDPVTGVTLSVGQAQRLPNGDTLLPIIEQGSHYQNVFAYSTTTGVLATIHQTAHLATGTITANLTLQNPPR